MRFRHLRPILKRIGWLRSGYYLMREIPSILSDSALRNRSDVNRDFERIDPWSYQSSPMENARFAHQIELLKDASPNGFGNALEIGCAEGAFTRLVAPLCGRLTAVDLSPAALQRARARCSDAENIEFRHWDLRRDDPLGPYDLVLVAGVLDYFSHPRAIAAARRKIVTSIAPGGHLLLLTTRSNEVVERSWWGKCLLRGRWINHYIARDPALEVVAWPDNPWYELTLFRRRP